VLYYINLLYASANIDTQILSAESEENKNEWLAAITTATQNYYTTIPDIKSEQRKTIERESTFLPPSTRDSGSIPSTPPAHTSLPVQSQLQPPQRGPQRFQSPAAYSSPANLPQTLRPAQNRPISPNALMKFDFAVTEGGEEEEEMTFQARRLMFERGLLSQAQVVQPPRPKSKPVAKLSAKSNPKNLSKVTEKQRDDSIPASPGGNNAKLSQPTSARNDVPYKAPEIRKGIVDELKQKYDIADEGNGRPKHKDKDELHSPLLNNKHNNNNNRHSNKSSSSAHSDGKKDSRSCCVIL